MPKRGKNYLQKNEKFDRQKSYPINEAITFLKDAATAKFDETAEVSIRLGIDPRKADQMVRGTVLLPHGLGKEVKVLVFAKGEKELEARDSGADFAGGEELVEKIKGGWMEFDKVVATPDMMGIVGKIGKILGPRGLMPNPKVGTVTFDVRSTVDELKKGKVEFRSDKGGNLHVPVGKASFEPQKICENILALIDTVKKMKPPASKGNYLKNVVLSSTMGPGIKLDISSIKTT